MKTKLDVIELNPDQDPIGTVIWLHGLGADGNDFVPIVKELKLPASMGLRFVFPNAPLRPVTVNNGYVMRAWYDIYSFSSDQRFDVAGIADSVRHVENLIKHENERGIPSDKIVIAGFSQGAVIALNVGLQYSHPLAGVLALSGYLPHADEVIAKGNPANLNTPFFIGHGTQDNVVLYSWGRMSADALERHRYKVGWHSYAMAHSVCEPEVRDIAGWLTKIFTG